MAEEVTIPEGGQQPPAAPAAALPSPLPGAGGNDAATRQLVQATEQLTQIKAQLEAITKERDTLKTGLDQTTAKATDLETRFNQVNTGLQAKEGEVATLTTQLQQTLTKVTELTGTNANLTKQTELFNVIAGKPEFHAMVGSFQKLSEVIKPDAPKEAIESLLATMATEAQKSVTSALEIFRAGGSPPANHGGETNVGPKNKEEAWGAWQEALKSGDAARQQQAMTIFNGFIQGDDKQTA